MKKKQKIEQVSEKIHRVILVRLSGRITRHPFISVLSLDNSSSGLIENLNNNASIILHPSTSNLSNTLLFDDTTQLTATLAQSTSSHISHSRYLSTFKEDHNQVEELEQLITSNSTPMIEHEQNLSPEKKTKKKNISSIRWFVRQAIDSCRQNLTMVDQLLENLPSSYGHILQRKVHRTNCIVNIPNSIKGLHYCPSTSVQTE